MPKKHQLASRLFLSVLIASWGGVSCATAPRDFQPAKTPELKTDRALTQIAFGSCTRQDKPQPIWSVIEATHPDLLLLLGDNIYGDSHDPRVLREKYQKLASNEGFHSLRTQVPIWATWDDHDYGLNDEGAENPNKKESKRLFLEFFQEPRESVRWGRDGVYDAKIFGPEGQRVQIILLDTRYFRGPLTDNPHPKTTPDRYVPSQDTSSSMLGEAQWKWLEEELRKPAEIRLIVSSIQLVANHHGWEKWGNLPHERKRFFDLLAKTGAQGVVVLSGDRHKTSIDRETEGVPYPIYDFTSSAFNNPLPAFLRKPEPDPQRISPLFEDSNFGWIQLDWKGKKLTMEARDAQGKPAFQREIPFQELAPKR